MMEETNEEVSAFLDCEGQAASFMCDSGLKPAVESLSNMHKDQMRGLDGILKDSLFSATEPHFEISTFDIAKPYYHQLLVLGNGFDLECGLPSKYSDFFGLRFEALKTQDWRESGEFEGLGYDASPTIWDFLLNPEHCPRWSGIEEAIGELVLAAGNGDGGARGVASKLIDCIHDPATLKEVWIDTKPGEQVLRYTDEDKMIMSAAEYVWIDREDLRFTAGQEWSPLELVNYLRLQLQKFEENFSGYMLSVTEQNDDYLVRADRLIASILADEFPSMDDYEIGVTVLNFNYTNPFRKRFEDKSSVRHINVHGSLDEGIIFGIDSTKCTDNPLAFPFSKTYRVMTEGIDFGEGAVHIGNGIGFNTTTRLIKFYGHSLGEADYAYFQAIFDGVNLYAGETKLLFYYRPRLGPNGKPEPERAARDDMVDKVTKLLSVYGKTLDNEDHGRNLIHKLMIEGRVEVRLLEDYGRVG